MKAPLLLLVLAVAGCAALKPPVDQVDGIVREAALAARAPAADQKAALSAAQKTFLEHSSTLNRLRLATLLASLPAPLRDDARAVELLEPIADPAGPATGRFAALLASQLAERQRAVREAQRLSGEVQKLSGEVQRLSAELDRLTKERASLERERQAADKERDKREEALRQQLEALRAIERGILDREEKLRRNPGAKP